MKKPSLPVLILLVMASCNGGGAGPGSTGTSTADNNASVTTEAKDALIADERDSWQHPEEVLEVLGDLQGKVVADLFAEDGYWTFRLAARGARVIAVVSDEAQAQELRRLCEEQGLGNDRVEVRVATGSPGLGMEEADMALASTSYVTILDRPTYFEQLRAGLKDPNRFFLVDFKQMQSPVGPPSEYRVPVEGVLEELSSFGFSDVAAHSGKLPYQFILLAQDYTEMPTEENMMNIQ